MADYKMVEIKNRPYLYNERQLCPFSRLPTSPHKTKKPRTVAGLFVNFKRLCS